MEKSKKSKKKLIGIIAGCAMAFVLTVVVSVAVTLAYFGDKATGTTDITMGQALTFDQKTLTASNTLEGSVLPGATGAIEIKGSVAKSSTKAFMRVKIETSSKSSNLTTEKFNFKDYTVTGVTATLVKSGNYYYLADGSTVTNKMVEIDATVAEKEITVKVPYTIDKTLTNNVAGEKVTVTVTMEIIQSEYVGTTVEAVASEWSNASSTVVD